MRMVIVVPPHTKNLWLWVTARILITKHPDVVVLGPVEDRLHWQLNRYKVPMVDPPPVEPRPNGWWPRIKHWWHQRSLAWDPWDACDGVLILWDHSAWAKDNARKARARGKKIWIIKMTDDPTVEVPMIRHH